LLAPPDSSSDVCRYKEAIKACNEQIALCPDSRIALKTRARAFEHLGFFKQALADAQAINKGDGATQESLQIEKRLKEAMSANKAKLNGGQAAPKLDALASPFPYTITVKASYGDDTKALQASLLVTYPELYEAVKSKFQDAGETSRTLPLVPSFDI
jgi:hypothetical protein